MGKYKEDKNLELLQYASQDMLAVLVGYLTTDKDGSTRYFESLTGNDEFKKASGDYQRVWKIIASELQHFGGDTIVNMFRGTGVEYKEILTDVCKKLSVKIDYSAEAIEIEQALLAKLFTDSWEKMSEQEQAQIYKTLNIDGNLKGSAALADIIGSIRLGGFTSYQVTIIVANAIANALLGRGLAFAANAGLARMVGMFAGPVGIAITALLTLPAFSGPAFRVTLPAVVQVAAIRQQLLKHDRNFF